MSSPIARDPAVPWTAIGEQVVMLSVAGSRYYETNAVGAAIWTLLEAPRSVPEIVDHVVARFRVERAACEADVRSFLAELGERGLLAGR